MMMGMMMKPIWISGLENENPATFAHADKIPSNVFFYNAMSTMSDQTVSPQSRIWTPDAHQIKQN